LEYRRYEKWIGLRRRSNAAHINWGMEVPDRSNVEAQPTNRIPQKVPFTNTALMLRAFNHKRGGSA